MRRPRNRVNIVAANYFRDLADAGRETLRKAGNSATRLLESELWLGVTGLRRSGKTVFVTALVDNLLRAGRLPFLDVVAGGRYRAARLQAQPDWAVPRFDYERHLADLTGPQPRWPTPTRAVSEVRLALRFEPSSLVRRRLRGVSTLTLDIVDYPGEWLLDLALLERDFARWSAETLALARRGARAELAGRWLEEVDRHDPASPAGDETVRRLAALYTEYLKACRDSAAHLSLLQPGRFLEPGELEGAPVLAFCPVPEPAGRPQRGSLRTVMEQRYEAYKRTVVRRFFTDHFSRLDRQVVLVDLLGALQAGPDAVEDMRAALTETLGAFRHGRATWLSRLLGGRIDRVLFAATKADHVAADQHQRLRALLEAFVDERRRAMRFEGAEVSTMAIASVKATETVATNHDGRQVACVKGIPAGRDRPTVLYPGELPQDLGELEGDWAGRFSFLDFLPPSGLGRDGRGLPNVRLDQALQFLIGDRLA
jgi:predicted YcjX-like family ATPase